MLGISFKELLNSEYDSLTESFVDIMSGFALNAVAYYFVGQTSIYKDHLFIIGVSATVATPVMQLVKDAVMEGCNQLYYGAVGTDSGFYTEVDL